MKTLEMLAFLKEAKNREQLKAAFGNNCFSNLANLVRKGAVRKFDGASDHSEVKHARLVVSYWIATGEKYETNHTKQSPRRDEYRAYYEKRNAAKQLAKTSNAPHEGAHACGRSPRCGG